MFGFTFIMFTRGALLRLCTISLCAFDLFAAVIIDRRAVISFNDFIIIINVLLSVAGYTGERGTYQYACLAVIVYLQLFTNRFFHEIAIQLASGDSRTNCRRNLKQKIVRIVVRCRRGR